MNNIVGNLNITTVPYQIDQTGNYISVIINVFFIIAGLFAFWQLLSAGFQYITAGGEKAKYSEAMQKITNSILGLVIIVASFIIVSIIGRLLFGDWAFFLNPKLPTI